MDKVNLQPVDVRGEVVEPVQLPFLRAPVETLAPVADQVLEIRDVGAVGPAVLERRRKPRACEPCFQVGKHRIRHADRERHDPLVRRLGGNRREWDRGQTEREEQSCGGDPGAYRASVYLHATFSQQHVADSRADQRSQPTGDGKESWMGEANTSSAVRRARTQTLRPGARTAPFSGSLPANGMIGACFPSPRSCERLSATSISIFSIRSFAGDSTVAGVCSTRAAGPAATFPISCATDSMCARLTSTLPRFARCASWRDR